MNNKKHREAELPIYLFKQGTNFESYCFFGSHPAKKDGKQGICFTVWAPNAHAVSVTGDFNKWQTDANPLENLDDSGVWQGFVEGLQNYTIYKYCVVQANGEPVLKADPYAFHAETRPGNCSKIYDISGYSWGD
ncbi:MAG: 1,4-alpha-glucan branching enzyme, partial [Pygmaiobacter sp.]